MTLDDVFGPRKARDVTHVERTNWPDAPEFLRPLLDGYSGLVGWSPQGKNERKEWISAAHEWRARYGSSPVVLREAFQKAVVDIGIGNIKNMRSVMYAAAGLRNVEGTGLKPCEHCFRIGSHEEGCPNG